MRTNSLPGPALPRTLIVALGVLAWIAPEAAAQYAVDLIAAPTTTLVTLPNGSSLAVPMWGFALDANLNGVLDSGEVPTVPGPRISVPAGTSTLTINLTNLLTGPGAEPVSIVVPGQRFEATPVTMTDAEGRQRVVAMTPEAPPNGGKRSYTFSGLKAGTFLYHSGSHPAVQVQMGLYGALTLNVTDPVPATTPGTAYPGVDFDHDVVLLFGEIDVALHQAVADGRYGTTAGPTSTIDYAPSLYLINGASYAGDALTPPLAAGLAGQRTLLRLLNAGLKSHAPTLDVGGMAIVAEDGNKYPFARPQAALLLSAGKTHDAIWAPAADGVYSIYDRLLGLNALGQGTAGMLAKLRVAASAPPAAGAPVAVADTYVTTEDVAGGLVVLAAAGVLANDNGSPTAALLVTPPNAGVVTLNGNGSFVYTPAADFFGVDGFTYRATNASGDSSPAMVLITIAGQPDAPVAAPQSVEVTNGETLPIVLAAVDADREPLTYYVRSLPAHGALSRVDPITTALMPVGLPDLHTGPATGTPIANGTLVFTPSAGYAGSDSFLFAAADATLPVPLVSADAAVSINVLAAPTTACTGCTSVTITVTDGHGVAVPAFRWTVEEDRMFDVTPGNLSADRTLAVNFHTSYMPVVQSGVAPGEMPLLDFAAGQRYFVSVLPTATGLSNGGAPIDTGQTQVNVTVDAGRIPTAQIRVRLFEDNAPLNNAWDNVEPGLPGFAVTLEDAGGRYGKSAGQQLMDAFGNPLGTTYRPCTVDVDPGTAGIQCASYEVMTYGNGFIESDADGYASFENLVPGKYGVKVIPPAGQVWQQTSTIEGTKVIDAWVKANEPSYFTEFGPPGPHAIIGFTKATNLLSGPGVTITGQVTNLHLSRPPDPSMYSGAPFDFTRPWVALNSGVGTAGTLLYAQPTEEDGTFSIAGVAPGSYTLVVFDSALDIIVANRVVNICAGGNITFPCTNPVLGDVAVFQWFSRLYNYVFEDNGAGSPLQAENGFRDANEAGIPEQAINIRWRDGSMYQSSATDGSGFVPFEEVFPFFSWLVAEVDFTRHKATGVTVVVDEGGNPTNTVWAGAVGAEVDPAVLAPQPQADNANLPYRTETGPVLLQAFQGFLGQSSVLLWGKTPYAPGGSIATDINAYPFDVFSDANPADGLPDPVTGDNDPNGNGAFDGDQFHGGVSGIVHYSITRAENDPRWGVAEPWEPGVPRVRVQLWNATRTRLLNEVTTDSWDDSLPEGCAAGPFPFVYGGNQLDCYDGLRNWNQVRPGVFDGGYAFLSQIEPVTITGSANWLTPVDQRSTTDFRQVPLPAGNYIVKAIVPKGYKSSAKKTRTSTSVRSSSRSSSS